MEGHDCPHCYGVLLQMCAHFYFSTEISRLSARLYASIVWQCFSPRDNDEQICMECYPSPSCNCLSIIPAEHIARVHASSLAADIATILNSAPRCTGMKQFEDRIRAAGGEGIMQYVPSLYSTTLIGICWVKAHDWCYLCDCRCKSRQDVS